jgi:CheY-like chemotaxis protein
VVEDEQEIRQTLAEALRQRGYQVLEAADGRQALSVYRKNASTIALVVLDLVLPELDGRRVYEELAKLPNPPAVLLSTGYVPDSDPLLARLPRLLKPFSLETFLQEVEKRVKPTTA